MAAAGDWQDMAFFCLARLDMTPGQVAAMLAPDDEAERHIWMVYLRERFAYARRHATIAAYLGPRSD